MDPPTFAQRVGSIAECASSPSQWHLHEGYVQEILEFDSRSSLDNFLHCLERGGSGSKSEGTWVANPQPYNVGIDLRDKTVDNKLGLHVEATGRCGNRASIAQPSEAVLEERA